MLSRDCKSFVFTVQPNSCQYPLTNYLNLNCLYVSSIFNNSSIVFLINWQSSLCFLNSLLWQERPQYLIDLHLVQFFNSPRKIQILISNFNSYWSIKLEWELSNFSTHQDPHFCFPWWLFPLLFHRPHKTFSFPNSSFQKISLRILLEFLDLDSWFS